MADELQVYRESLELNYWGGLGNGVGLLARVEFYNTGTYVRWLPQSREHDVMAISTETLHKLCDFIDEDKRRVRLLLSPSLSDGDSNEDDGQ